MTIKDSSVIDDVVRQHARFTADMEESASRRCKAARLGTGYALEFATAGQGLCHCLPPARNRFHDGTRVIVTRLGADFSQEGCVRQANSARPPGGLRQHFNSFSSDARLRLQRGVAQTTPSIQLCRRKESSPLANSNSSEFIAARR
jgi:hypothetical protein